MLRPAAHKHQGAFKAVIEPVFKAGGFALMVALVALAGFPSQAQETTTTTTTAAETTTTEAETTTTVAETTTTEAETTTTVAETTTSAAETTTTTAAETTTSAPVTTIAEHGDHDDEPTGTVSEDLAGALSVWNERVRDKEVELEKAKAALETAESDWEAARAKIEQARQDLIDLEDDITAQAINAFREPDLVTFDYLTKPNMNDSIRMRTVLGQFVDQDFEGAEELRIAKEDLAIQEARANRNRQLADQAAERIEAELAELEKARDMKASLTAKAAANLGVVTEADIVTVRGFEVHRDIADAVEGMLAHAEEDGFIYTGGGYRSFEKQIEIRKNNCGTSYYAIWQMPSSRCSPPTARPGASQHEKGLAMDFVCGGGLIRSRSSDCFQWLAANAEFYGFYNLPSEPWHWSVNGR